MSLMIRTNSQVYEIHVGENFPQRLLLDRVIDIQADGDELDYINEMFPGFRCEKQRVVRYFGCIAQTILGNWNRGTWRDA